MRRRIATLAAAGALVCLLVQLIPMSRSNPPITQDVAAPPQVESILRRGCYDCHSNQTRWPWYAHVAPVSWLAIRDVDRGRKHLNFSTWDKYSDDPETVIRKLKNIDKLSHNDAMPPWYYSSTHSDAHLSPADRELIERWALEAIAAEQKREQSQP